MSTTPHNRILLIDDMPSIHEDFRKILVPPRHARALAEVEKTLFATEIPVCASFDLDCATGGEEGLALLKWGLESGRPYSVAFVDMRMPAGWDGSRTIEELWRADPQLQVVICTAYSDHPLQQEVARLESHDRLLVLKKPFDPVEVSQLARSLTAKRRLARESAAYLASLEQVVREMRAAGEELRRRNEELEALARSVTQSLRSPIVSIGTFAALLAHELRGQSGGKVADYLARVTAGARQGEELVRGVLALTEISRAPFDAESLDLSRMAREHVAAQREAHPQRHVSAGVQDGLRGWGDARLVNELVGHLADNAWKFTGHQEMAAVTFGAQRGAEGETVFFVRDSGCGFDPAKAGKLFREFQRLHPHEKYPGAGVGLVAAGRIVERHGGRAWADSRPGEGTTIYFTLPNPAPRVGDWQNPAS